MDPRSSRAPKIENGLDDHWIDCFNRYPWSFSDNFRWFGHGEPQIGLCCFSMTRANSIPCFTDPSTEGSKTPPKRSSSFVRELSREARPGPPPFARKQSGSYGFAVPGRASEDGFDFGVPTPAAKDPPPSIKRTSSNFTASGATPVPLAQTSASSRTSLGKVINPTTIVSGPIPEWKLALQRKKQEEKEITEKPSAVGIRGALSSTSRKSSAHTIAVPARELSSTPTSIPEAIAEAPDSFMKPSSIAAGPRARARAPSASSSTAVVDPPKGKQSVCAKCSKAVLLAERKVADGQVFHARCFTSAS
eukprot:m.334059 g.334059  ORF g.334059 m.334059 type:complete len:305 (-) comp55661_c0_seq2:915-1829(-)